MRVICGMLLRGVAVVALAAYVGIGIGHADPLRVAKGASTAFSFTILDIGIEEGIFKKNGLDIEASSIDGAARLHQAMVANSIDIALGAGTDIAFIAKGSPEKGIGVLGTTPLNMALVVRADGPIKSMESLKGKTVGITTVGSLTDWFARQINYREKWTGDDAVKIAALGSFDGTSSALIAGNIDALAGGYESGVNLETQNRGKVLFTFGEFVKPFITHAIYATNILIAKDPNSVRAFLKGWYETVGFVKTHREDTIRISKPLGQLPKEAAEKIYAIEMPMFPTDGHYDPAALDVVVQSLLDTNQIDSKPDIKTLITEQFLD